MRRSSITRSAPNLRLPSGVSIEFHFWFPAPRAAGPAMPEPQGQLLTALSPQDCALTIPASAGRRPFYCVIQTSPRRAEPSWSQCRLSAFVLERITW